MKFLAFCLLQREDGWMLSTCWPGYSKFQPFQDLRVQRLHASVKMSFKNVFWKICRLEHLIHHTCLFSWFTYPSSKVCVWMTFLVFARTNVTMFLLVVWLFSRSAYCFLGPRKKEDFPIDVFRYEHAAPIFILCRFSAEWQVRIYCRLVSFIFSSNRIWYL